MLLDVTERSSSFFDETDEKNILNEMKAGLPSARSGVGDHLKKDEQALTVQQLLSSKSAAQEVEVEANFYALEGV
jgi:hypothetical protein